MDILNPLTPMSAITGCDEPWPFFHFWRHHFWPKLASSMLNFCRRRRSFQWCPNQSDRPNGAWDMHKNVQKVERKTQTKICCHHTWLLHGKSCPFRWRFQSQNVAKRDASGKKAKLSWCKCIFDQIKANLAEIQPKSHQNVQETPFLQKAPGVNGLGGTRVHFYM